MSKNTYNSWRNQINWKNTNQHNKLLIEDYVLELKARNRAVGTISQYENDLKLFATYLYDHCKNIPFHKVSKKQIRNFIIVMQNKEMSPARINRILSSIRTMYDYAMDDEDYEDDYIANPAAKIKGLKKEKVRAIEFLTMEQIEFLHKYLMDDEKYQQALLLAILIDSAARKNEVYQIKKSAIKMDDNFTNEVKGKGGKTFELMYHDLTKETYKYYLRQRGEDDFEYLWYTIDCLGGMHELPQRQIYEWVKSWNRILKKEYNKEFDINVHSFRHSALDLFNTGEHYMCKKLGIEKLELSELQLMANHNDISTTNSYLQDRSKDILKEKFKLK